MPGPDDRRPSRDVGKLNCCQYRRSVSASRFTRRLSSASWVDGMAGHEPFRIEVGGRALPAQGPLYGSGEVLCSGTPDAGRQRSCHACQVMAVVVSGRFNFRSPFGQVDAMPGAIIFGNALEEFEYRFVDTVDVHKSVVALDDGLVAEVAGDCGVDRAAFGIAGLLPGRASSPLYASIRRLAAARSSREELAVELAASAVNLGREPRRSPETATQTKKMREIAAYLDDSFSEPLTLAQLAAMANLRRFHFIRAFRAATGETPRQYLIGARLRAAADRLLEGAESITEIALGVGFNDISHFNATFRQAFGTSPRAWRKPCIPETGRGLPATDR